MEATKIKLENKLQQIYITAGGYDYDVDNRSYFTKSINKALSNPIVFIKICKKGYHWTNKNGFQYSVVIRIEGKGKVFNLKNPTPEILCEAFATVAKMEHVKETMNVHQDAYECEKCHGKGFIPAFRHICKGVCFDCLGIGYRFHSGDW